MDSREIREVVEQWSVQKLIYSQEFSAASARNFVEVMNYRSKQLIRLMDVEDAEWWTSLTELANGAATICDTKAKTVVDGRIVKP